MSLKKDKSTPENKAFWKHVEAVSRMVKRWPAWMRKDWDTLKFKVRGQTTIEYLLILSVITVVIVTFGRVLLHRLGF